MANTKKLNAMITGLGMYFPEKILDNAYFEKVVDTTDEWIRTRTGIIERRMLENGGTSVLAIKAAEDLLRSKNLLPEEIDFDKTVQAFSDQANTLNFEKPELISKTKIYWFDDGPDGGCRLPDEWEIQYLTGNIWKPVKHKSAYKVTKNGWDSINFVPVKASAIKIQVKLNKDFSAGIYEWIVE